MKINVDVLIVGTGIAGLYSALNLREDLNVLLLTKSTIDKCNSYLAQGGISTALDEYDKEVFVEDTMKSGAYKNKREAVEVLADESIENIDMLCKLGVKFDKGNETYDYTKEGAHSANRIIHCNDHTGKVVFEVLRDRVKERENIQIIEDACLVDIINKDDKCMGGVAIKNNKLLKINAKVTILASGGIGGQFKRSTNWRTLTGNGLGIALRNKIKVKDINFIQFHPTALYEEKDNDRKFLISESLRGEGAILVNKYGERFTNELESRDVVSNAIRKEMKRTNEEYVYLDATILSADFLRKRFNSIYEECLKRGIDITKDKIPVVPTQHYFMGGIEVDLLSKTSMENLYACGEVSCTGVHGANRLASNSLLEALVFSKRAADNINEIIDNIQYKENNNCKVSYWQASVLNNLNNRIVAKELLQIRGGDLKDELVDSR